MKNEVDVFGILYFLYSNFSHIIGILLFLHFFLGIYVFMYYFLGNYLFIQYCINILLLMHYCLNLRHLLINPSHHCRTCMFVDTAMLKPNTWDLSLSFRCLDRTEQNYHQPIKMTLTFSRLSYVETHRKTAAPIYRQCAFCLSSLKTKH